MVTRYAGRRAKSKARQVFRKNRRKSKRSVLKKFANFVGKVTYKTAGRRKRRKSMGKRGRMSYTRRRRSRRSRRY